MIDRKRLAPALGLALTLAAAVAAAIPPGASALARTAAKMAAKKAPVIRTVKVPSSSPLVAIRLMFSTGSSDDPAGKEGLASLTASVVAQGGTAKRSYGDLLDALYPMAASIDVTTDRDVTVVSGVIHRDNLAAYTALLEEALLRPGFAASDFERNREQHLAALTNSLRAGSDETLGLEALQDAVYAGHPYGHPVAGTVAGLKSITLDDVRQFYQQHFTRANLLLGIAGGYPADFPARLQHSLLALPAGQAQRAGLPPPPPVQGRHIELVEKQTGSVGIHFGYPLPLDRSKPDYYPLMVANSALGEHRTSTGRLMSELRGLRGLNYGDYSYIEFLPSPPAVTFPPPGVPRRQQYFSVWIRPVAPDDAQFALRAALWQLAKLHDQGLTREDFDLTRNFLLNYTKLWVQDLSARLGVHMDSVWYGMPYYIDEIDTRLRRLTLNDVNRAARTYLSPDSFAAVIVTDHAAQLQDRLEKESPSPKTYNSQVAPEVLADDKAIAAVKVMPAKIEVAPVEKMFER
jgi:zinc protease